jgi:serine/threonine-protein kinase
VVAGKYLIESVIGQGGLGVVVAARHIALEQSVAIKYLLPAAQMTPTFVERFIREARLAARIKSEHVARVFDVATHESGVPYIVMEHLVGRDLRSVLEEGPIPTADAVDFVLQACEALAEAHKAGIVHRDLKPDNFFLAAGPGGGESIKLLDFGISKMTFDAASRDSRKLTGDNDRFGTPDYMSPEHLRATANVDARADVWSLGVVLFECLTGKVPFEGNDFPQLCVSILTAPPLALRRLVPDAPPGLEAVIARCLEKEPENRFQNIGELAEALLPFGFADSVRRVDHIRRVIEGSQKALRSGPRLSYSEESMLAAQRASSKGLASSPDAAGAEAAGVVAITAPETTRTAMELRDPKPRRSRSAVVLASTAVVAVVLGVTVMMLRGKTEPPPLATGETSASHAAAAGAMPPGASGAPSVATPAGEATSAAVAPTAEPPTSPGPSASNRGPVATTPRRPQTPGKSTPAAAPSKRPAAVPAPTFDPGGVVNPFQ